MKENYILSKISLSSCFTNEVIFFLLECSFLLDDQITLELSLVDEDLILNFWSESISNFSSAGATYDTDTCDCETCFALGLD